MTLQDAITYYQNTLIAQYRTQTKALQTIQNLVNCAYSDGLPFQFSGAFNLATATGAQLTIIGKIVGVPRNIFGLDLTHQFFNYSRWAGLPASNGFNRWGAANNTFLFARWQTTATYTVTDFEMAALIKLKIIYNNNFESLSSVKQALYTIFAGGIDIVDNKDYSITYNVKAPYYNVGTVCSFVGNILPKPMGVTLNVVQV